MYQKKYRIIICNNLQNHKKSNINTENFDLFIFECTKEICSLASFNGSLNILKWARENNCTWDEKTCNNAALNGHIEVLEWACQNGCTLGINVCKDAFQNNNLEVLKWTRMNAVLNGNLEFLDWFEENRFSLPCIYTPIDIHKIIQKNCGQEEIIKWYVKYGKYGDGYCVMKSAAEYGHLSVLKWAHQNNSRWDKQLYVFAAEKGHFEVLQWLHENGCPWHNDACTYAVANNHLEIVQWIIKNDLGWISSRVKRVADHLKNM